MLLREYTATDGDFPLFRKYVESVVWRHQIGVRITRHEARVEVALYGKMDEVSVARAELDADYDDFVADVIGEGHQPINDWRRAEA
jgi:hypothetical protein